MDAYMQAVYLSSTILLVGGLVILCWSLLRGVRQQTLMLSCSFVVFLAAVALRLPVQPAHMWGLERVALAAVDALRYFTLGNPFQLLEDLGTESLTLWYRQLDVIVSLVAPLCTTMILLSVMQMLGWVRFRLFIWRPVYCFSELNQRSFAMAQSVMEDWQTGKGELFKPVLVFFKTEPHDDSVELEYRAEAQRMGASFYRDPIHAVQLPDPWMRRVKVFLIDENEDSNMGTATRMKDWICPLRKRRFPGHYTDSDILVFSTRASSEVVFDKLLEELKLRREKILGKDRAAEEDARIDLHLINETKLIAQKLMWDHPLYEGLESPQDNQISMLLVGGGRLGMELLRTAMVCGVMDTCSFRATVVDANAEQIRRRFRHEHSQLPAHMRDMVIFREADVDTNGFDRVLESQDREPNYIVVATGDDERNVTTAQFLQRWYARKAIREGKIRKTPCRIYVAIRDQGRYEALEALREDGLILFGCHADIFRREMLLDRPIDLVAMRFHSAYNARGKKFDPTLALPRTQSAFLWYLIRLLNLWESQKRNAKRRYYALSSVDLHSNQLVVMHSIYKFRDMLRRHDRLEQYLQGDVTEAFVLLLQLMSQDREILYRLEHRRWEVFQTLDGWQPFPLDKISDHGQVHQELSRKYWNDKTEKTEIPEAEQIRGLNMHKHMVARLHGCLTPYEQLAPLADTLNAIYDPKEKKDFLEYDRVMCVNSLIAWLDLVADPAQTEALRTQVRALLSKSLDAEGKLEANHALDCLMEYFVPATQETP